MFILVSQTSFSGCHLLISLICKEQPTDHGVMLRFKLSSLVRLPHPSTLEEYQINYSADGGPREMDRCKSEPVSERLPGCRSSFQKLINTDDVTSPCSLLLMRCSGTGSEPGILLMCLFGRMD